MDYIHLLVASGEYKRQAIETALILARALDTKVDYLFRLSPDTQIFIERNMGRGGTE